MNIEQLRHILRAAAAITGENVVIEFIRELLKHRLINRGKILRLIDSEKDQNLKQLLVRNWTIVISRKTK